MSHLESVYSVRLQARRLALADPNEQSLQAQDSVQRVAIVLQAAKKSGGNASPGTDKPHDPEPDYRRSAYISQFNDSVFPAAESHYTYRDGHFYQDGVHGVMLDYLESVLCEISSSFCDAGHARPDCFVL